MTEFDETISDDFEEDCEDCEHVHDDDCDCGHDHSELQTVVIETDDGEQIECSVLGVFNVGVKEYIALLPIQGDSDVLIFKYSDKPNEPVISDIEDDAEYELAVAEFTKAYNGEEEEF
ncbi:hypothetical protein FACS189490_06950 [Clostridia bacterium]|nr:hypothetical protein FACS189490_06950 [Clostridia bacterium]